MDDNHKLIRFLYWLRVIKKDVDGDRVPNKWNPLFFITILFAAVGAGIIEFFKAIYTAFYEAYIEEWK